MGRFCDASHSRYALVVLPNGSPVLGFVGPELMRYSASNFARPSRMSVCRARPVWYAAVSVGSIARTRPEVAEQMARQELAAPCGLVVLVGRNVDDERVLLHGVFLD